MKKIIAILTLAAVLCPACKKDKTSTPSEIEDEDMSLTLDIDWSAALDEAPSSLTLQLYPMGKAVVDDGVQTFQSDEVNHLTLTLPEQDYALICFNQSEAELTGYTFDFSSYESASVTADDPSQLAPLAVAAMNSVQDSRGLSVAGVLKPTNVVKSMTLQVTVPSISERVVVNGTLSNMAKGVTMFDQKPLPEPVDLPLPPEVWNVPYTDDDEQDIIIAAAFNTFGVFVVDETRVATRSAADLDTRNILHVTVTKQDDGTVIYEDKIDVTEEVVEQYLASLEGYVPEEKVEADIESGHLKYHISGSSATVTGHDDEMQDVQEVLEIPESVTYEGKEIRVAGIGKEAFKDCSKLTSVTMPNSIKSIDENAFYDCHELASVTLSDSLTTIGTAAFYGCDSLESITIPRSMTSLSQFVFCGCKKLQSVNLPETITEVESYAFYNCQSLASISLPNSVTSVGSGVFADCVNLTEFSFPTSVTTIGSSVFLNCFALTTVNIPASVTSIGSRLFTGCDKLTELNVDAASPYFEVKEGMLLGKNDGCLLYLIERLESFTVPDYVTSIDEGAFTGHDELTEITILNTVKELKKWTFYDCHELHTVTFDIDSIGEAFSRKSSLTTVNIGSSVKTIGEGAFDGDSYLEEIYCYATTPPSIAETSFSNVTNATLYVPAASIEAYRTAWGSVFTNILSIEN